MFLEPVVINKDDLHCNWSQIKVRLDPDECMRINLMDVAEESVELLTWEKNSKVNMLNNLKPKF